MEAIPKDVDYDLSIFAKKQNMVNVLKELTYHISSSSTEIKTAKGNQIDIDILNKQKDDAKNLRKDIQINNEEVFFLNIYITFYYEDKEKLLSIIKSFQSRIYSKGLISNITNFRHLDSYLLTLPTCNFDNRLLERTYRNITTSSLSNIFPFYTRSIFDKDGILFGYTLNENKLCNIDIFNDKYLNSNMCVFGSSGSGKSFFIKLLIQRHFLTGKYQYIIDPENEYINIVDILDGEGISFTDNKKCINILDIFAEDIAKNVNNFLDEKINILMIFLVSIMRLINQKDIDELREGLIKVYQKHNITNDINSVFMQSNDKDIYINKVLKTTNYYPILNEIFEHIKSRKLIKSITDLISKYPCLNNHTNIDFNNHLIVFNTSNMHKEDVPIILDFILDLINTRIDLKKDKSIIYIDEVWKYIGVNENNSLAEKIFTFFKTIRKKNASIIIITQDISDIFNYQNGMYAKSILNNSAFKLFFRMDFSDCEVLQKLNVVNKDIFVKSTRLDKGQAILIVKDNTTILKIKANNYESFVIKEGKYEDISSIK